MAKFKTCNNGHNYDESKHSTCPYCPENNENADYEKTIVDFKKTQLMNDDKSNQFDKTMINNETTDFKSPPVSKTPPISKVTPTVNKITPPISKVTPTGVSTQNPFKRTTVVMDDNNQSPFQESERRKLVGWLVSFCADEFGQDYKLYVGKNKIGSAPGCDVLICDSSISGEHTIILFRDNEFLIKDNFSTNGTKINGISVDEGKLKDGDEIKLGNTTFKFKSVF